MSSCLFQVCHFIYFPNPAVTAPETSYHPLLDPPNVQQMLTTNSLPTQKNFYEVRKNRYLTPEQEKLDEEIYNQSLKMIRQIKKPLKETLNRFTIASSALQHLRSPSLTNKGQLKPFLTPSEPPPLLDLNDYLSTEEKLLIEKEKSRRPYQFKKNRYLTVEQEKLDREIYERDLENLLRIRKPLPILPKRQSQFCRKVPESGRLQPLPSPQVPFL